METLSLPWKRWDVIAATCVITFINLGGVILIFQIYESLRVDTFGSVKYLILACLGMVFIVDLIMRQAKSRIWNWLKTQLMHRFGLMAIEQTLKRDYGNRQDSSLGTQIQELHGLEIIRTFLSSKEALALVDLPYVLIFMGCIYYLSPILTVIPTISILVFGGLALYRANHCNKVLQDLNDLEIQQSSLCNQIVDNYHTVKALGMEALILRRYEGLQYQAAFFDHKFSVNSGLSQDWSMFISYLILIVGISLGMHEVLLGNMSIAAMTACMVLIASSLRPMQILFGAQVKVKEFYNAYNNLGDLFAKSGEASQTETNGSDLSGEIQVRAIEFRYPNAVKPTLSDLSLDIQPHTLVAIFGSNGAGKTTLARLLLNQLSPQQGDIRFDGISIADRAPDEISSQIGYVSSKTRFFTGTIMENLTLFRVGPLTEEAVKLSIDLGLDPWIRCQPQAYQTYFSAELISTIPDGIKQRIALVRALLNEPKILILDEATTAIDEEGGEQLKKVFQDLKEVATILIITHRPSIKQIADDAYDLVNGTLVPSMNVNAPVRMQQT